MSDNTQTITADPVIAQTQHAPVSDSFESVLSKQLNHKPKIERTNLKSLEDLPESQAPTVTNMEEVKQIDAEEFLKQMDSRDKVSKEDVKVDDKEVERDAFDLNDIDFSKEPDAVAEKPKKKSKEDNIAELRKKAEAYEESLKAKDSEVLSYREKLEKLEGELERTAFERSPKFKDKYEQPYQTAIAEASEFAKEIGDDASIAEKALSLKGRERMEFIDESFGGGAAASQFLSLINNADAKRGSLESALENYRATSQELIAENQLDESLAIETINKNFDRVKEHLASRSEFFRTTGDEESDKVVNARIEAARNIIHGTASQNEMQTAPFLAVIARDAVNENIKLKAELAKYKNRAAADAAVQPRISKTAMDDGEDSVGKPRGALDSIRSQLR